MKRSLLIALLILLLLSLFGLASILYPRLAERYSQKPTAAPEESAAGYEQGDNAPGNTPDADAPDGEAQDTASAEQTDADPEDQAQDFLVYDADGNEVHLSDFFGKPIVVNFWATWCPPCRSELPAFDKASGEYGDRIEFLMVDLADGSRETVENALRFVQENGYSFPVYYDSDFDASYTYGIYSIPMTLFIRADGSIAASYIGAMTEDTLYTNLESLTQE